MREALIPLKYQKRPGWTHTGLSVVLQMPMFCFALSLKASLPMAGVKLIKVPSNPNQSVIANPGIS